MSVTEYKVDWLDQLKMIADKCDQKPTRVTIRDLRNSVIFTYEALMELKEAEG